jgi:hypothetical protein
MIFLSIYQVPTFIQQSLKFGLIWWGFNKNRLRFKFHINLRKLKQKIFSEIVLKSTFCTLKQDNGIEKTSSITYLERVPYEVLLHVLRYVYADAASTY